MVRSRESGRPRLSRLSIAIAAGLLIAGCGADAAGGPTRQYVLHLRAEDSDPAHYLYVAEDPLDVRVGDRVTLEVRNDGTLIHDLEVRRPDGQVIGTAPAVGSGGTLQLEVEFAEAGIYSLRCNVDDHLTKHRMQALVEVKPATA
jgi:uncharacterized cupredoxin-like copper-binding protein